MLATLTLLVAAAIVVATWYFLTRNTTYWKQRGLPYLQPQLLFGNAYNVALQRQSCSETFSGFYNRLNGHPLGGLFLLWRPALLVRDPAIAGLILTKDFDCFRDRGYQAPDSLLQDLFFLEGDQKWKTLRTSLEPGFGPEGARHVFFLIDEMAQRLMTILETAADREMEINVFDEMQRFVIDAVGTCAFGVEFESMKNANSFVIKKTKQVTTGSILKNLKKTLVLAVPDTARAMGVNFLRAGDTDVFRWLASEILKHRRRHNVRRSDLIDMLMRLADRMDGHGKDAADFEFDGEMFAAQVFMLLMVGREKTANTLSFCLHEIAVHPGVQNRARLQVDSALRRHGGQLTLGAIQDMPYLDMVLSETLRLHPPLSNLSRKCTAEYSFPGTTSSGGGNLKLAPGEAPLYIPICALHRDHNHFANPDRFDPERFSAEQAAHHKPFTYMPFGEGPRSCLGKRLALLLMKTAVARLLSRYELFPSSRTEYPAPIDPRQLVLHPKGGLWVKISHRHWLPCD